MQIQIAELETVIENIKPLCDIYLSSVPSLDFVNTRLNYEHGMLVKSKDINRIKLHLDELITWAIIGRAIINKEQ